MSKKEIFLPMTNEVNAGSLDEIAEELKAMRFAFGILFTQLPETTRNGIIYQLKEAQPDSANRLATFLEQLQDIKAGSVN